MGLKLKHIFTRIRVRGSIVNGYALVDGLTIPVEERQVGGVARLRAMT